MWKKMKRQVSMLLVLALLAGVVAVPNVVSAVSTETVLPTNLLSNGDFEVSDSIPGWNTDDWQNVTLNGQIAKDGNCCIQLKDINADASTLLWSSQVDVYEGVEYVATAQAYGAAKAQLTVRFYDASGALIAVEENSDSTDSVEWDELYVALVAPVGAQKADVLLSTDDTATGAAYFDRVSFMKKPVEDTPILEQNFDDSALNANGFPTGWSGTVKAGADYSLDSEIRKGDAGKSVKLDKTVGSTSTIYINKTFEVKAGKTYRAEMDYYGTLKCQFYITTFDGSTQIDNQDAGEAGTEGQWTHLTNELVATADATKIRITIGLGGAKTGTVYFDNVRLVEVAEEEDNTAVENPGVFLEQNFDDSALNTNGFPTGWSGTVKAGADYSLDSVIRQGDAGNSVKLDKTVGSTSTIYINKTFEVKAGKTYRAEMDYYGTLKCQFYISTFDGSIQIDNQDAGEAGTEGQWTHLTNELVATADATKIRITIGLGGAKTGTVYFDNIRLVDVEAEEEWLKSQEKSENKLANASFEAEVPISGWNKQSDTMKHHFVLSNDVAKDHYSLSILDDDSQDDFQIWSDAVAVQSGKDYKATVVVSGSGVALLALRFEDNNGDQVGELAFTSQSLTNDTWTAVEKTSAVPEGAAKVRVILATEVEPVGEAYFDNASLVAVESQDSGEPSEPEAIIEVDFDDLSLNSNGFPSGWKGTVKEGAAYSLDSEIRKGDAGQSVKLVKTVGSTSTIYIEKTFEVKAGKTYRAEVDYYGTVKCQFYITTFNGSTQIDNQDAGEAGTEGQWTHLTNELVATADATKIRITIGVGGAKTGTVYFDNVRLVEVEDTSETTPGETTPGETTPGETTPGETTPGETTPGETTPSETPPQTDDAIINQNFDDLSLNSNGFPSGWKGTVKEGATYSLDSEIRKGDAGQSVKLVKTVGSTSTIYIEKTFEVKAGKTYRAEVDYYGTVKCQFYITTFNGSTQIDNQNKGAAGTAGEWTTLTNELVATADATKIRITIGVGGATTGTVYFDNVRLVEVEGTPTPPPEIPPETPPQTDDAILTQNFNDSTLNSNGFPSGWSGVKYDDAVYSLDNAVKMGDSGYSLKLIKTADKSRTIYINKTFEVKAGKLYRAEMDYYGTVPCQFYISTFDGSTQIDNQDAGAAGTEGQWTHLTNDLIATGNATKIRITIGLGGKNTGTVYFDNIRLVELEAPDSGEEEETPDVDTSIKYQDDFNDSTIGANGLPSDWGGTTAGGIFTLEDATTYLQMTKDPGADSTRTIYYQKSFEVKKGATYRFDMDYYGVVSCQMYLSVFSEGKQVQVKNAGKRGVEYGWKHLTNEFVAETDGDRIRITIGLGGTTTGVVGFDNLRLVEITSEGETVIYAEDFEDAKLKSNTMPSGWNGTIGTDTRFKLVDLGKLLQLNRPTITEESPTLTLEFPYEVKAGRNYHAIIQSLGFTRVGLTVEVIDGNTVVYSGRKSAMGQTESWIGVDNAFVTEKDGTKVRVTITLDATAAGKFQFDNFLFIEEPEDNTPPVTEFVNPSFEEPVTQDGVIPGWTVTSYKESVSVVENMASDGKYSVKLDDAHSNAGLTIMSSRIDAVPDALYMASADVCSGLMASIYIRFLDKYGQEISTTGQQTTKRDGEWYTIRVESAAPSNAAYVVVLLASTAAQVGTIYFDNLTIKVGVSDSGEGSSTPAVVPEGGWNLVTTEHPRLYFTQSELEEIKSFAKDSAETVFGYSGAEKYDDLIDSAERYLKETKLVINYADTKLVTFDLTKLIDPNTMEELKTVPPGFTGKAYYPYWQSYTGDLWARIKTLTLAYAISGEVKYAERAIRYAMEISEWSLFADAFNTLEGYGQNTCMETGYLVFATSTVYDICYDLLTVEQRKQLKNSIITKGLDVIYDDLAVLKNHNYYMVRCAAMISGALAVADDVAEVETYLTRGYNFAKWYLDNLYKSGDNEGFLYNCHQLDYMIEAIDHMQRVADNRELIEHDYFSKMFVDWMAYFMAPGSNKLVAVGDSEFRQYGTKILNILCRETDNAMAGFALSYAGQNPGARDALLYTCLNPKIADADEIFKPVVNLDKLGYGGLRSGWGADDVFLTMVGYSSAMHHNHFDQLSITFSTNGQNLMADGGYAFTSGGVTSFLKTYTHCVMLVDGNPQEEKGTGSLKTMIDSQLYGYLLGSAPDAYGSRKDGNIIDEYDRHAIMLNHSDRPYYVVFDNIASSKEHVYNWNLYTSGWNGLEVDGKPLELESSTKGNMIAVATPGGMLYAEFVAEDPLNITAQKYNHGDTILIDNGASKATQYMAILTKSYGEQSDEEYSFLNALETDSGMEYVSSSKDPVITKSVAIKASSLLFFRGEKPGDYIKLPFTVKEAGTYTPMLKIGKHFNYGIYKVYLDGKYINTYDALGLKTEVVNHSLGEQTLTAGQHELKLELVGTNSLVGLSYISIQSIVMQTGESLGSSLIYSEEVYDNDKVLGAKIHHNDYNSDIVLFNRGTGLFQAGAVVTDAQQASILGLTNGVIAEGFAATNATSLVYDGITLLKAENPVSVGADFRGICSYTVTTEAAQTVKLYAADSILGVTVDGEQVEFVKDGKMAVVELTAGTHEVVLKVKTATKIEYLEDGTVVTTVYNQNGKIVTQHFQYADGTEVKYGASGEILLRVYIDEDTLCMVREEVAEDGTFTTTYYDVLKNIDKITIEHPDGSMTEIDYQSDGTIVTTVSNKNGDSVEGTIQYPDGSVTKAEYKEDCTITTKIDKDGNITSIAVRYKDGRQEETVYNADGTIVTTKYAKGGKLSEVYTQNADGTAVKVEYLENGAICTTKFDASGNVIEKITTFKDGSYISDGFVPEITEGNGQTYTGEGGLVFSSNDEFINFKYVTINGEEIDPAYYIAEPGSIKVTLPVELLSILPNGEYTIGIVSTHGTAEATFQVVVGTDSVSVWLWIGIGLAVVAAGAIVTILVLKRKKAIV